MTMSLASVESTRRRPGIGNLRHAAEERCVKWRRRQLLGWGPGERLGFIGEGGVERSHRGCNVWQETVVIIYHSNKLL